MSRRKASDQLRDLTGGGLAALRAAADLIRADGQLQVRVSAARKALYQQAAKGERLSLSAWILRTLDAEIETTTLAKAAKRGTK